jgi:hypothetical protein
LSSEKGAGYSGAVCAAPEDPCPPGRPHDGRYLGLVGVRFLRGNRPPHDPVRRISRASRCDVGDAVFSPASLRTGRKTVLRDTRCSKRSGLGRSPRREQSRRRVSRLGFSTPDPAYLRRLSSMKGHFQSGRQPSQPLTGGLGCSSGPWSCSLNHLSAETGKAHAAPGTLVKTT